MKNLFILFSSLLCISSTSLQAQQSINASGRTFSNANGSVSYSVGQIIYTTITNVNGTISQGVQQPLEIFTLDTNDFSSVTFKMQIYPNPTSAIIILKIENILDDSLEYNIFNSIGNKILSNKIVHQETIIPFENLSSSIYFLNITDKNKIVKTFKIIKNN